MRLTVTVQWDPRLAVACRELCLRVLLSGAMLGATACGAAPTPPPPGAPSPVEAPAGAGADLATDATGSPAPRSTPTAQGTLPDMPDAAALERHLAGAGIALRFDGEQLVDWLDTPARVYQIGDPAVGDSLEVHVYPDETAARAAAARVQPDGRTILDPTGELMLVDWKGTPHFFQRGPLLAIYIGDSAEISAALAAALGPPFAGGGG